LALEKSNCQAMKEVYNPAYVEYQMLNSHYIVKLQKGKIDWGWQATGFISGSIIGILVGRATK
jgi:hypothetical protein